MSTINKDSWDIRCNRQKVLSFLAIFCSFIPLTNQKIKIFKKCKKVPGNIIILHVYHEWQSYDVRFVRYGVQQAKSFLILDHFLPFFTEKSKFWKKKQPWRYHQLTLVYHKWQSYDAWFLKYKVQQTEFLWTIFCPFDHPPKNLEN